VTTLPPHLQPRLDRELDEGEEVRWVAQPSYRILRKATMDMCIGVSILLGLLCFTLTILGVFGLLGYLGEETMKSTPENWALIILAGLILIGTIAGVIFAFRSAKYTANNTIYAITEKRAIIIVIHKNKSITERDYRGDELVHLARIEFPDGSGTLTFESARGAGGSAQTATRHRFHAIDQVSDIERILREQFGNC
jgi:F0F1-type ATP synthase assembly protein I